jgi:hypothetical protein
MKRPDAMPGWPNEIADADGKKVQRAYEIAQTALALRTRKGSFVLNDVNILAQNGVTKLTMGTPHRNFQSAQSRQIASGHFDAGVHRFRCCWAVINQH